MKVINQFLMAFPNILLIGNVAACIMALIFIIFELLRAVIIIVISTNNFVLLSKFNNMKSDFEIKNRKYLEEKDHWACSGNYIHRKEELEDIIKKRLGNLWWSREEYDYRQSVIKIPRLIKISNINIEIGSIKIKLNPEDPIEKRENGDWRELYYSYGKNKNGLFFIIKIKSENNINTTIYTNYEREGSIKNNETASPDEKLLRFLNNEKQNSAL